MTALAVYVIPVDVTALTGLFALLKRLTKRRMNAKMPNKPASEKICKNVERETTNDGTVHIGD